MPDGVLPNGSTVKRHTFPDDSGMLPFVSMPDAGQTLGDRIKIALEAEGRSQNSVETAMIERGVMKARGQLSRLVSGKRGKTTTGPLIIPTLAKILHVREDWLLLGEPPMRRDGRAAETPFETAMGFARQAGCREDAIQLAWEDLKGREPALSVHEWALAFDAKARSLKLAGVPRPEKVVTKRLQTRRVKNQIMGQIEARKEASDAAPKSARKRASGGV